MVAQFRVSPSAHPPLRIGLLLDGVELSRFFGRIIEDITASNFAKLELLIFRKFDSAQPGRTSNSRRWRLARRMLDPDLRKRAFYDLYLRFDEKRKPANHPLDTVACSNLLAGVESIQVEPIGKKFVHRFPPDALERIRSHNLDVLLRLGFNILRGEILTAARYGVWSYHHGDNDFYRGGPPHFWELYEDAPLSGVILQVLTEELDGGLVLCKSLFATEKTLSVSKNRYAPYWGSTDLVIRKLNELHQFGWDYVRGKAVAPAPYQGKRKIYRSPTNADMVRWLGPVLIKKAVQYPFRRNIVQHWRIALRRNGTPLFDSTADSDVAGFSWMEAPKGHFWADPFVLEHEGTCWVFFEDFSYQQGRAGISCAQISMDGRLTSPTRCLDGRECHYSYPHVFRSDSEIFMTPETVASQSVNLYRCRQFPDQWTRETTLLEGRFVDTSVWKHDGLWWLLTTSAEPDSRSGCLLLFYADSLTGKWTFHPMNPISTDVRNCRNAGRVFCAQDRLIRPSQSCSTVYGYSFTLNEIVELSTEHYAERPLKTVEPHFQKDLCATHTYNWSKDVEVIDGATWAPLESQRR
jgi:hypothetical protein